MTFVPFAHFTLHRKYKNLGELYSHSLCFNRGILWFMNWSKKRELVHKIALVYKNISVHKMALMHKSASVHKIILAHMSASVHKRALFKKSVSLHNCINLKP